MKNWFRRKEEPAAPAEAAPEAYQAWQPETTAEAPTPNVPEAPAPEAKAARPIVTPDDLQRETEPEATPAPEATESAASDDAPAQVPHGMSADDPLGPPILKALQSVYDPEIPVDIYQLGLIYSVEVSPEKDVSILMTLTTPGCPVAGQMPGMVEYAVQSQVEGVRDVEVEIVWEPPWTPDLMSEAARLELGFM